MKRTQPRMVVLGGPNWAGTSTSAPTAAREAAAFGAACNEAMKAGVAAALREHKSRGNPIAISRDGKVVILKPDEIPVRD